MSKQIQEAYIVAATRTPVGKAPRGMFRNTRPDDLLAHAPLLDPAAVRKPKASHFWNYPVLLWMGGCYCNTMRKFDIRKTT